MASYLDKFKLNTAISDHSKFDLSCQHITTADFMQLSPVYFKEMVPTESISVNQQTFTRMAPLAVPTFGRMNINNRAFFVPYRTIFPGWSDFITDTVHVNGVDANAKILADVPHFTMPDLSEAIFYDANGSGAGEFGTIYYGSGNTPPVYDMSGIYQSGSTVATRYIQLNAKGRQALKILNSLGYQVVSINSSGDTSGWKTYTLSALPLLSYLKVYLDWYWPSQFYDQSIRYTLESFTKRDSSTGSTSLALTSQNIATILSHVVRVNYDSDYFVSSFANPVGPTNAAFSDYSVPDISSNRTVTNQIGGVGAARVSASSNTTYLPNNGTPVAGLAFGAGSNNPPQITEYLMHSLYSLTDYMKRHQLVGARALDRYLARFGVNLKSDKLDRSIYIGMQNVPVQIGDVMMQGNSASLPLGAYAGKGLAYGESSFDYETDEYGMFIIMSSLVPKTGYYQGIDRTCLHNTRLDFWTPEFDALGNQAITTEELYVNQVSGDSAINSDGPGQAFGFTPRYAEYKVARDRLTGDWRVNSINNAGDVSDSWHLLREFDDASFNGSIDNMFISRDFCTGSDAGQYDRIFNNTQSENADHFYVIHNFDIASYSPMRKLYDTYEFHDEVGYGKDITVDVNGVKVN